MTECFLYLLLCNTIPEPTLHKLSIKLFTMSFFSCQREKLGFSLFLKAMPAIVM